MNNRQQSDLLVQSATYVAVIVAITLVIGKAVVWSMSGSVAMLASLADSALDAAASLVTLVAVAAAIQPPDKEHRFGHGKAEALAGLFQAAMMAASAFFLFLHAIEKISSPDPVEQPLLIIQASGVAIVLSLGLVAFQAYVVKKTGSLAIAGDYLHYRGDLLMNLGVIAAAYLASLGHIIADPIIGILIAIYILSGAYEIGRSATDMLMDKEFEEDERSKIKNLVHTHQEVIGLHELKTRASGRDQFIQLHVVVDGSLTVSKAHGIADEVEAILSEHYPDAEIIIHIDPPEEGSD